MDQLQLKAYLEAQGIDHTTTGGRLRVMDASQLPQAHRALLDERGYFKEKKVSDKQSEEEALEAAKEKVEELDKLEPMTETEKEMTTVGLLNPEGNTDVPPELESHTPEPKAKKAAPKTKGKGEKK